MTYPMLRFVHIVGFILLGGGLIAVFVADLRSRRTGDIRTIAEACRYVAVYYDGVVVPGAVIAGISGLALTLYAGLGFFNLSWQTGMWALFLFEFVEGNTVTRIHFRRMFRLSKDALACGEAAVGLRREQAKRLPAFTHFIDLPLFFLIVSLGALRPSGWATVAIGAMTAAAIGAALFFIFQVGYRE